MGRKYEVVIPVDATPEQIWKGLTDANELQKWLAPKVDVKPGKGGSIFLSWGPGQEGTSLIDAWEQDARLRTVSPPSPGTLKKLEASGVPGPYELAIEWSIETRDGKTYLRLVHSGFGDDASWDSEFNGISIGWAVFMRNLRHVVSRHFGKPQVGLMHMIPLQISVEDAWDRMMAALDPKGSLAGKTEGDRYSIVTTGGDKLEGLVDYMLKPKGFIFTVEPVNNSLFGITLVNYGGMNFLTWGALVTGMSQEEADKVKQHWADFLTSALS